MESVEHFTNKTPFFSEIVTSALYPPISTMFLSNPSSQIREADSGGGGSKSCTSLSPSGADVYRGRRRRSSSRLLSCGGNEVLATVPTPYSSSSQLGMEPTEYFDGGDMNGDSKAPVSVTRCCHVLNWICPIAFTGTSISDCPHVL
jgi:hypothetical protein